MIQLDKIVIDLPYVTKSSILTWKKILLQDTKENGGSASMIVRRLSDNKPLKLMAFDDGLFVIEILDGFSLAEELAQFQIELNNES